MHFGALFGAWIYGAPKEKWGIHIASHILRQITFHSLPISSEMRSSDSDWGPGDARCFVRLSVANKRQATHGVSTISGWRR